MTDGSAVYVVNLIIGIILAGVMSRHWRLEVGGRSLQSWIVAAWILTLADLLFVLRVEYPAVMPRLIPPLVVTAGHAALVIAAQHCSGAPTHRRLLSLVAAMHAVLLVGFHLLPEYASWRSVTNGLVWGSLSFAAAASLWRADAAVRRAMALPAVVLAAQGAFHAVRMMLATRAAVRTDSAALSLVQLLGDFEVSLFMVALFVSVLVAFLQRSNDELRLAMADVRQLSALLPLCSWCHKVRDDDGYWTRIESYLADHRISVTHGLCESCEAQHFHQLDGEPRR